MVTSAYELSSWELPRSQGRWKWFWKEIRVIVEFWESLRSWNRVTGHIYEFLLIPVLESESLKGSYVENDFGMEVSFFFSRWLQLCPIPQQTALLSDSDFLLFNYILGNPSVEKLRNSIHMISSTTDPIKSSTTQTDKIKYYRVGRIIIINKSIKIVGLHPNLN